MTGITTADRAPARQNDFVPVFSPDGTRIAFRRDTTD